MHKIQFFSNKWNSSIRMLLTCLCLGFKHLQTSLKKSKETFRNHRKLRYLTPERSAKCYIGKQLSSLLGDLWCPTSHRNPSADDRRSRLSRERRVVWPKGTGGGTGPLGNLWLPRWFIVFSHWIPIVIFWNVFFFFFFSGVLSKSKQVRLCKLTLAKSNKKNIHEHFLLPFASFDMFFCFNCSAKRKGPNPQDVTHPFRSIIDVLLFAAMGPPGGTEKWTRDRPTKTWISGAGCFRLKPS